MQVEILVQINEEWVRLDSYNESPAMVFQINDLNDLTDRQASYSQSIDLPLTDVNCKAFGYVNMFEAKSRAPYTILPVQVYVDGSQIVGDGYRIEIRSIENGDFKCQIVSNTWGLMARLGEQPMSELNLPPFFYNMDDAQSTASSDGVRQYLQSAPVVDKDSKLSSRPLAVAPPNAAPTTITGVVFENIRPYYNALEVLRQVFADQGYTVEHDIAPEDSNIFVSLPKMGGADDSYDSTVIMTTSNLVMPAEVANKPVFFTEGGNVTLLNNYQWALGYYPNRDPESSEFYPTMYSHMLKPPGTSRMRLTLNFERVNQSGSLSTDGVRVQLHVVRTTGTASTEALDEIYSTDNQGVWVSDGNDITTEFFDIQAGEPIAVCALAMETKGESFWRMYTQVHPETQDDSLPFVPGQKVYPGVAMDFKNQSEYVKAVLQIFGFFLTLDNVNMSVKLTTFDKLLDNVTEGVTVDWTKKIDNRPINTRFRVGSYARQNRILMTADDVSGAQAVGVISVDDDTLAPTKDLFTIQAESNVDVPINLTRTAYAETSKVFDGTGSEQNTASGISTVSPLHMTTPLTSLHYKVNKAKTHFVMSEMSTKSGVANPMVTYTGELFDEYSFRRLSGIKLALALDIQGLVDRHYQTLQANILNPARVIEADFNLSPSDIANLDLLKPVYLEQFGDYFYIQKIDNYIAGQLTKVTLVCLNITNKS